MNSYKSARIKAELTAQKAAEELGVAISSVYAWESGKFSPSGSAIAKMTKLYGVSADELIKSEAATVKEVK